MTPTKPDDTPSAPTSIHLGSDFATALAEANARATEQVLQRNKREQEMHPGVSVFNPQGERDHPKVKLTRETFWCGYRLHDDELTPTEIGLLNRLAGGSFRDGEWTVREAKAQPGQIGRIEVMLPASDIDKRMELPRSMTEICQDMLGETMRATEFTHLSDAQAEITRLRALVEAH